MSWTVSLTYALLPIKVTMETFEMAVIGSLALCWNISRATCYPINKSLLNTLELDTAR